MAQQQQLLNCLAAAAIAIVLVDMVTADIFTSSLKVQRLAREERVVLDELKSYIDQQHSKLQGLTSFHTERMKEHNMREGREIFDNLEHPNAAYKTIKRLATDFASVLGDDFESFRKSASTNAAVFETDIGETRGASLSLLRLQAVYHMKTSDMARGDYLGYQGPPLTTEETYAIAKTAFTEGMSNKSLEWADLTLTLLSGQEDKQGQNPKPGYVKALMGRAFVYLGDVHSAQKIYDEVSQTDPQVGDVYLLAQELHMQPRVEEKTKDDSFNNFSRLCSLEKKLHVTSPQDPSLVCRYKEALLPYYRFKEEILSVSPYASVFYNFTTDNEAEFIKDHVHNSLARGKIGLAENNVVNDIRTSDLAWILDNESVKAAQISLRVKHLTGLEVDQNNTEGAESGEAFQVVNYGLGGHYDIHTDPLYLQLQNETTVHEYYKYDDRIATFLIYLSDVTRGGSTVFTWADIAVAPVKNMALFWYSFNPAHKIDAMTHHAGCPVLIGHKWIANKWIRTSGNTFRRRCGLTPDATQLDIEPDMNRLYVQPTMR